MAMPTLSSIEVDVSLLSALNLSLPKDQPKLRQILAKRALTKKASQTFGKPADSPAFYPPLGLEAPPGFSVPDGFGPPPGLAPPAGLTCAKCSTGASGTDGYIASDADQTSTGAGSMTRFVTEGNEPEAEAFHVPMPCFVPLPSFPSTTPCKVLSPHKALRREMEEVLCKLKRCMARAGVEAVVASMSGSPIDEVASMDQASRLRTQPRHPMPELSPDIEGEPSLATAFGHAEVTTILEEAAPLQSYRLQVLDAGGSEDLSSNIAPGLAVSEWASSRTQHGRPIPELSTKLYTDEQTGLNIAFGHAKIKTNLVSDMEMSEIGSEAGFPACDKINLFDRENKHEADAHCLLEEGTNNQDSAPTTRQNDQATTSVQFRAYQ